MKRQQAKRIVGLIPLLFFTVISLYPQDSSSSLEFTGVYSDMETDQRRIIDNWFERYNSVMGKNMNPEEGFNMLPLSIKTTFQAVTNALLSTDLTDKDGNPLGNTLSLVEKVDNVAGKIKGAGGDQQFRMYCVLIDGARDILEKSQEFKRGHDNTVYHKGYPLNYRQQGGVPSMQISMSLDEKNADIDVDYRSSKFPAALFNGHLTSSNSDVRAGNNFERHTGRWIGLQDWWANWFSLSLIDKDDLSEEDKSASIPKYPPKGKEQIHEAANDFFTSWLVEQNPALAMSYVSSNAFECLERPTDEPLDAGMAPFQMLVGLKKSNEKLGKIENLTQIFTGIRVAQPDLRVVEQPYHSAFVLYDVPESRALEFICSNRGLPENEVPQGSRNRYGKYYATAMFIQAPNKPGETLAVLWTKENGYWKIISWESEPETDMSDVPDLRTPIVVGSVPRVQGKPEQISAAADFLDAWFIEKDYDRTLGFFSEECFDCMNLFLQEDEQPFSGKKELSDRLRLGLERTAEAMGSFDRLDEVIRAFEPVNPDHPMVTHEHESTYTLISVPDYVAGNYGCRYRLSGGPLLPAPEQPAFGNHYVLGFHVKTYTGEPAVLFTLWSLRSGQWKITAFHIERP